MGGRFFWLGLIFAEGRVSNATMGGGGGRRGYASQTGYNTRRRRAHSLIPEPEFVNVLRSPRIDSKESIPPAYVAWLVR